MADSKQTDITPVTDSITAPNPTEQKLHEHFSHFFDKTGKFDFKAFKQELTASKVDFSNESYGMDWLGKSYARLLATDPARTILAPDTDWNAQKENQSSQHLLLKGDNLEVLKHLSQAYYEQVKMIYIDPPYNTGSDGFVYEDDRKFRAEEFASLAGVDLEEAKRILKFVDSKSNSHSAWLTFMYPRLYIARTLLKDDGVIFISIDDNEVAQLRILMDEIFGEENFIAQFVWKKKQGGGNDSKDVVIEHEYLLAFSKSLHNTKMFVDKAYSLNESLYPFEDEKGKYGLVTLDKSSLGYIESLDYEITGPDGEKYKPRNKKGEKKFRWRWSKEKVLQDYDHLVFKNGKVYTKYYRPEGITPKSLLVDVIYGRTESGNDDMKLLFGSGIPFSYPKPVALIKHVITIASASDDLILDFFAGSGTTGHAVMAQNAEDGGARRYILVQLDENTDKKSEAYKAGYQSIFDLTRERLSRAAAKIQTEYPEYVGDLGCKVFETRPIWEGYHQELKEFDPQAQLFDESRLTDEDIFALLTTWKTYDGVDLSQDLEEVDLGGYVGYYTEGRLYLMHRGFTTEHIVTILRRIDEDDDFAPKSIVVFGYMFETKHLRELSESVKNFANKKHIDIEVITRY